jgi:hypothetical protein
MRPARHEKKARRGPLRRSVSVGGSFPVQYCEQKQGIW